MGITMLSSKGTKCAWRGSSFVFHVLITQFRLTFSTSHFTCDRFSVFNEQDCQRSSLRYTFSSPMRDAYTMHHRGKGSLFLQVLLLWWCSFRYFHEGIVQLVFSDFTLWANTPEGVLKCELQWHGRCVCGTRKFFVTGHMVTDSFDFDGCVQFWTFNLLGSSVTCSISVSWCFQIVHISPQTIRFTHTCEVVYYRWRTISSDKIKEDLRLPSRAPTKKHHFSQWVKRLQGERSTVDYCGKRRCAWSTSTQHWYWQLTCPQFGLQHRCTYWEGQ